MGQFFARLRGGGNQSAQPSRITDQDKAVLVSYLPYYFVKVRFVSFFVLKELKVQRDKLKKYQKKVIKLVAMCPYSCIYKVCLSACLVLDWHSTRQ